MAEVRCPMCGNPNPETADSCVHCGARLKPVTGGEASSDWLGALRDPGEGEPDEQGAASSSLEDEDRAADDEQQLAEGAVPEWLQRIRKRQAAEQDQPADDFSDLRAGLSAEAEDQDQERRAEPEDLDPERSAQPPEASAQAQAEAGRRERRPEPEDPRAGFDLGDRPEPEDPRAGFDLGDRPEPEDPRSGFDLGDRPEPEDPRAGFDLGDQPEPEDPRAGFDLGDRPPKDPRPGTEPADEPQAERPASPFDSEGQDAGRADAAAMPSWLREAEGEADQQPRPDRPEEEAEQRAAETEPESELPHVSPLIGDQPAELEADEHGLPDWLGEIEPLEEQPEREPPEATPSDLERATLPNWLEAMRPVDTFRSVVQIEAEDDQEIESVGPLAGLRGVLLAEPVVAMPRTSTTGAMQLEVSERQYAQAELLNRMISEEQRSQPAAPKRRRRLSLFRWAIAALTLVAAALPVLTGTPSFALPGLEPKELGPLFDLVGRLPADRPALFVFDYDPGSAGELDAVSGALLDQVMGRGLPVASLSTRPTGPPLAERAMRGYAVRHGYEAGSDLIHLGYLSGGPAAVQLFSVNPRSAVRRGFALPESMLDAGQTAWESPLLQDVDALSDFSMVTVITAGSETARVWVEQAQPLMGDTPLLMVLSAGAEPLVRPYYEASPPQIDGILTGLPAAVAYEQRNGRFGAALDRWNSFGAGVLAAELVLVAGAGYGLVRWVLARREG